MITPPFHQLIDDYRQRSGLGYEQLADRTHTSPSYLHRICGGKAKPSRDFVVRLCLAMNLSVDEADELLVTAGYPGFLESGPRALAPASA